MKIVTQHFTIYLFRVGKNFKKFFYQRRTQSRNAGTREEITRQQEKMTYERTEKLKGKNLQMKMKLKGAD